MQMANYILPQWLSFVLRIRNEHTTSPQRWSCKKCGTCTIRIPVDKDRLQSLRINFSNQLAWFPSESMDFNGQPFSHRKETATRVEQIIFATFNVAFQKIDNRNVAA